MLLYADFMVTAIILSTEIKVFMLYKVNIIMVIVFSAFILLMYVFFFFNEPCLWLTTADI